MTRVTIQELLDELDQHPEYEVEIDRYIFPLFNRLLNEHDFQLSLISVSVETLRCRIMKMPNHSSQP